MNLIQSRDHIEVSAVDQRATAKGTNVYKSAGHFMRSWSLDLQRVFVVQIFDRAIDLYPRGYNKIGGSCVNVVPIRVGSTVVDRLRSLTNNGISKNSADLRYRSVRIRDFVCVKAITDGRCTGIKEFKYAFTIFTLYVQLFYSSLLGSYFIIVPSFTVVLFN